MGGRYILRFFVFFLLPLRCWRKSQSALLRRYTNQRGKVREHVDKKVEGIETKVDNLITTAGTLSTDVAVNMTNITNMKEDIRDLKGAVESDFGTAY